MTETPNNLSSKPCHSFSLSHCVSNYQWIVLPAIMSGDKPNLSGESTACQLSPKIQNCESVSKKFNAKFWLKAIRAPLY